MSLNCKNDQSETGSTDGNPPLCTPPARGKSSELSNLAVTWHCHSLGCMESTTYLAAGLLVSCIPRPGVNGSTEHGYPPSTIVKRWKYGSSQIPRLYLRVVEISQHPYSLDACSVRRGLLCIFRPTTLPQLFLGLTWVGHAPTPHHPPSFSLEFSAPSSFLSWSCRYCDADGNPPSRSNHPTSWPGLCVSRQTSVGDVSQAWHGRPPSA